MTLFHDGERLSARRGEPLALTLLAADRLLLSRSPKLHRPRGPYCLRGACEGCLVRINGLPNQPACRVIVEGDEQVETQNVLGTRATLVDDGHALGGALTALDPPRAVALANAARAAGARLLSHSAVVALSREPEDGSGRITALIVGGETTYVARCDAVLLACGRHDAVPAFPNNDLPGIFSARAALWAWRNDVLIGSRIALVGSGRYAEGLVQQMSGAVELVQLDASSVVRAIGRERITGVDVQTETGKRRIKVDALAFDGPGAPSFELAVQAGASVDFDATAGYFPRASAAGSLASGLFLASEAAITHLTYRARPTP